MRSTRRLGPIAAIAFIAAGVAGVIGTGVLAHVQLINPFTGSQLFWANEAAISIVISSAGSSDISNGSDETAIRLAIEEWNAVTGTAATLVEDTAAASQSRTDWESTDLHLIFFDESGTNPWIPPGSGIVAVTPIYFQSGGRITDSDIMFNGADFTFTTSGAAGAFDVQDVVTHEIGHLLGLDHSGWAGATMYPYVDPSVIAQRSLSRDEVSGLRTAYPMGPFGRITGTIIRTSDDTPVERAHVVAIDSAGRTTASRLTKSDGSFVIKGLDPDTYTIYATPLEGPVTKANLGLNADPSDPVETDFEPTFYGMTAVITATQLIDLGTLHVGDDVAVSLGKNIDIYPIQAVSGAAKRVVVRGVGLVAGSTLVASDPDITIGALTWQGTSVLFQVTVPGAETPGHADLIATNPSGEVAILPAAFEILPPDPTVASVLPTAGSMGGGTAITITGGDFRPGSSIVLGDQIYADGLNGTAVVNDTTIVLTTAATLAGDHDIVVIDSTGVEGRLASGFRFVAVPAVQAVFPSAGTMAGATQVVLTGADFLPNLVVRINGVVQGNIVVESASTVRFTTQPSGALGTQVLEVENTDGSMAFSTFSFAAPADPGLASVAPPSGSKGGGTTILLTGTNFSANGEVFFGADPGTGRGGMAAASVQMIDANTLEVVTPAHAAGAVSVMVRDAATGQASLLSSAFTYKSSGGGGGACAMRPVSSSLPPGGALSAAWWLAALTLVLHLRARRARPRTAAARGK